MDASALATRAALAADGHLLDDDDRAKVQALAEAAERSARSDDADAIEAATKALTQGTETFAAARMNQGIRQALAGRKVEEI